MMMAYGSGNGVQQDFNKAFSYALKCAENGDGTCMFNLISCYKEGMGTDKSIDKMLEWAIRLGKIENPENLQKSGYITSARLNLAYIYRDGIDVEQDFFKSYKHKTTIDIITTLLVITLTVFINLILAVFIGVMFYYCSRFFLKK